MCGIAGIAGKFADQVHLGPMIGAMARRGPDDHGMWTDPGRGIALGHARLAIIDLSAAGHQPMIQPATGQGVNTSMAIVFNGEIYNYKELRHELEGLGAEFRTKSDTEVILQAWSFWGKETPVRLRGMFAFAIWDNAKELLTLVRDRMGIKPLLWYQNGGSVVFASSLKAMLASTVVSPLLNEKGLIDYLLQGAVLQPQTMIRDVWSLAPGTLLEFGVGHGSASAVHKGVPERYWRLEKDPVLGGDLQRLPYEEQVKVLRQKLEEACRYSMIADVPVGSFLSGGVDSTAITALMARLSAEPIKSFSIGFSSETGMQNELSEARVAAEFIGCDHTEVVLTGRDVAESFDDFIDALDQPSIDGLNTYWVSKVTRERGIKVALSGLGGDELFAGYDHFRWANEVACRPEPRWRDYLSAFLFRRLPYSRMPPAGCRRVLPLNEQLATLRRFMTETQVKARVNKPFSKALEANWMGQYIQGLVIDDDDPMMQITRYECKNYLVNILLRDADALSMGHGLEVRPIFLDSGLVDLALNLPPGSKWRNGVAKSILKDAAGDLLPPDFFKRRKTGFTLPIHFWLDHELRERSLDLFKGQTAQALFGQSFLHNMSMQNPGRRNRRFAWQIVVLLGWIDAAGLSIH